MARRAGRSKNARSARPSNVKPANVKPLKRARDRRIVAGVDLGASKAACFIAEMQPGPDGVFDIEIIGVGCHGVRLRATGGPDVDEMETCLRRAVDAAERMAGLRVDKVRVAAPGRMMRARRIGVDLEIADGVVTQEDVDDSLREGAGLAAASNCVSLGASPILHRVDGDPVVGDPAGYAGALLSTEMLGLSARESAIDNLSSLVERCGLEAVQFIPAPAAAAESCLIEDERELGVVLIDIGATTTGFAVYDDGALVDCGGAALGGAHITRDIAQIFGAPLADAERIKTLHGAALIGPGDEHRFIDFPQLGAAGDVHRASRADLCEVIIPRMEEIFELVAKRLPHDGRGRMALRRAVITGGGSLLPGAREIAEKALGMKTRVGRPLSLVGAPEAGGAPGFSVCAGLIGVAADPGAAATFSLGAFSPGGFSLGARGQSRHSLTRPALFGGARAWLRAKF